MNLIAKIKMMAPGTPVERMRKIGCKVGEGCHIQSMPHLGSEPWLIEIGNHVSIDGEVVFVTHDGATWVFRDQPRYEDVIFFGAIRVLDNSFLGKRAMILPRVTIGPNSIVTMGSLVNKDVPPNTVVAGNPARVICTVEEYAEQCLARTPSYDAGEFRRDKRSVLEALFLHGDSRQPVRN